MSDDEIRGTVALLVNDEGEYLLHLRDDIPGICDPGTWSVIGGNREGTETLEDTIRRELNEEAGLAVPGLRRFTVVRSLGPDQAVKGYVQVFCGRWNGDASQLRLTEGVMLHWFDPQVVPRLRMCAWTKEAIQLHQARSRE
ncbi:NUDIX domain-containing protein [Streptomyces sp. bgisy100]|uniref:NUDIX domain-containing protein n=1 Tax=Streptomyces sp. bgisy100 TaxID=3413783 RepID=UPI003D75DE0F